MCFCVYSFSFQKSKVVMFYLNVLFVFCTLPFSRNSKTGYSGNKILPTQRISAADGFLWQSYVICILAKIYMTFYLPAIVQ